MRLWSLHPRHLDRQGLTACWREGLLAQAVIADPRKGYSRHPQLQRFRAADEPLAAIGRYLGAVADEADARGYRFARGRIRVTGPAAALPVSTGQLAYEWAHLLAKLRRRSAEQWERWRSVDAPDPHPSFVLIEGPIAPWERNVAWPEPADDEERTR
ncbi:MAG: pyrimidine dimer DNA glycosylase/endonuclease V [Microbacterium sp.]